MIGLIPALPLIFGASTDVHFTDCSLQADGELLDARFLNVDADPENELVVAVLTTANERELHIHELDSAGAINLQPSRTIPVLSDVLAWTFCDLRSEPGPELVFLTPTGAHCMSLSKKGLRGNLKRFASLELLFHMPDERRLDYWPWFIDRPGMDNLLLPGMTAMTLVGPANEDGARSFERYGRAVEFASDEKDDNKLQISSGGVQFQFKGAAIEGFLLAENDRPGPVFMSSFEQYQAPGMADVDGDGVLDLVVLDRTELVVYLSSGERVGQRREALPDYLTSDDHSVSLSFHDLDGDGDADLLGERTPNEGADFGDDDHDILVLLNDGKQLLPTKPNQVMRFSAANVELHIADIDGDDKPDLFTNNVSLPSLTALVTGLEFTVVTQLHLGGGSRGFERQPALKTSTVFNEASLLDAITVQKVSFDCSGDGLCDLVAVDALGRVTIRRLQIESSFFSGDSWALESDPWKRFSSKGSLVSLRVNDWNGDGIGDILSLGKNRLAIYMSRSSR